MADVGYDSILSTLLGVDKLAAAESPYSPLVDATNLVGKSILQASPQLSVKDSIIAGLLSGLASGGVQKLNQGYIDDQSALANKYLLGDGSVLAKPEGLNDSVFQKIQGARSIFEKSQELQKAAEIRQAELATDQYLKRFDAVAPKEIALDIAKQKATLQAQRELGFGGLPPALQDDYLKQQAAAQQSGKAISTIDALFDKAKTVSSLSTFLPWSTANNDLAAVQNGLTNMLQSLQGREMNDSARKDLQKTLPDWNDTKEQIDEKRALFKQMVSAIQPSTPLLSGSVMMPKDNKIDATPAAPPPQPQYEIRTAPDGQRYKVLVGQ